MIFGRSFNQDSQNSSHKPSPDQTPADFKRLRTRYQLSETLWRRTRVNVAIRVCSSLSQKQQEKAPSLHREVVLWVGNQKAICCLQVWDRLGKDGTSPSVKSIPPHHPAMCTLVPNTWQTEGRFAGGKASLGACPRDREEANAALLLPGEARGVPHLGKVSGAGATAW